jgi:hypothetical protein
VGDGIAGDGRHQMLHFRREVMYVIYTVERQFARRTINEVLVVFKMNQDFIGGRTWIYGVGEWVEGECEI